jgi:extracellular elastinolytic metalloproteinase
MNKLLLFSSLLFSVLCSSIAGAQDQKSIIQNHLSSLNIGVSWEIYDQSKSAQSGATHVYIRQTLNGISIANILGIATIKNNEVVHFSSNFKTLNSTQNTPTISSVEAVKQGFIHLAIDQNTVINLKEKKSKTQAIFEAQSLSKQSIPVLLNYYFDQKNGIKLAWNLSIKNDKSGNWYSIQIDAISGDLLFKNNWTLNCSFESCDGNHDHAGTITKPQISTVQMCPPPPGADQYLVFALPVESPSFGAQTLVTNPSDANASSFGWHDTNGVAGDESTLTIGNNVYATEDSANLDLPGVSPDGGTNLFFNFPLNTAIPIESNLSAATTNLFYMNNMMHDIWHYHGFDEASGNFQTFNYTQTGIGDDAVFAQSQDGSGTNNANMATPPEGFSPSMQMYIWKDPTLINILTIASPAINAASFGGSIADFNGGIPNPVFGEFVLVDDATGVNNNDGCESAQNTIAGKIAFIDRGGCFFTNKIEAAEAAGAIAVVIMNNSPNGTIAMGGTPTVAINIPAIMISQADGLTIRTLLNAGTTLNGSIQSPSTISDRDSDFDNGIIAHEYGHGISNRLVGGAANTDCLFNDEQMGEGWSDYLALLVTIEPGDQANDPRPMATYTAFQPTNGDGIRPAPYSKNFAVNNYTYSATNNSNISKPHGVGFVWASMLWDMTWDLIGQYGITTNIKTGVGGNTMAMKLVIEAMKLTPCGPGFVDARDAILAADNLLYNGSNNCLIWKAFAKRGLGFNASQGDPNDREDQVQDFTIPSSCIAVDQLNKIENELAKIFPNPSAKNININFVHKGQKAMRLFDLRGAVLLQATTLKNDHILDLENLEKGTYLLEIIDESGTATFEIVKI